MTQYGSNRAHASTLHGQPIDDNRSCASCGYNLRGLAASGRCPECGVPINRRRASKVIDFCDLPPGLIRKFSLGFYFAAATLTGIFVLLVAGGFFRWSMEAYAATVTVLSFVWFAAVWFMTAPLDIPYDQRLGAPWELKVRTWARWLQLGWFAHMGVLWMYVARGAAGGSSLLTAAYIISELAGVVGIVLLCLLLANLASWVRDDFAERCFSFTAYGLPILSILLFVVVPMLGAIALLAFFLMILLSFIWVGAILAFPIGMWSLGRSLGWAVRHSKDRITRASEFADSLAPEPAHPPRPAPDASDEPIPLDDASNRHEINYSMSQSHEASAHPSSAMRRDRYDHERGDAHSRPGEAPKADMF